MHINKLRGTTPHLRNGIQEDSPKVILKNQLDSYLN